MTDYRTQLKQAMLDPFSDELILQVLRANPGGLTEEEIVDEIMKRPLLKQLLIKLEEEKHDAVIH